MRASKSTLSPDVSLIVRREHDEVVEHTNRQLVALLCLQCVGAIVVAWLVTPRTWIGGSSEVHIHFLAALILGPLLTVMPIVLWRTNPTAPLTRHVIAGAQVCFSALLIHLTGGRIETHFHVFGSLALIAFYRDPWVLVSSSAIVALDHALRGLFVPQSIFGVFTASQWRWVEHAWWVVFEDVFLIMSIRRESRSAVERAKLLVALDERRQESEDTAHLARSSLERCADAVCWLDRDGGVVDVNEGACKQLGYTRDEFLRLNIFDFVPDLRPEGWPSKWERLEREHAYRLDSVRRTKDGRVFPVASSVNLVPHRDRLLICMFARDISAEKSAEQRLRAALEESEGLNLSLEEETIRSNRLAAKAEDAARAKSEFLANMSHEIRTPMTAILGFAETLSHNLKLPENVDAISTIRRNGEALMHIINDILDLSKIESGRMSVESIDCSPARLMSDVASLMRVRSDAKALELGIRFGSPVPERFPGDPTRLKQILMNLVGNAIKFTETGGVWIEAGFEGGDEPKVLFDVIDSGIGISSREQSRLFQPFSQADSSTTRRFGGTGLGLAISQRLAGLMGGEISIDSASGKGSRFRLALPAGDLEGVRMVDHPTEEIQQEPRQSDEPSERALDGVRILVAEDGPDNQRLMLHVLRKSGAEVEMMENGQQALDRILAVGACETGFDAILMDMQMPVMDGYEATRRMRAAGVTLPIVALTAHAMATDRAKCLDAGCDDYASKPIDRAALISTLRKQIESSRATV